MLKILILFVLVVSLNADESAFAKFVNQNNVQAGAFSMNLKPPIGVPLAGFSNRKVDGWPLPKFTKYTAFMKPSTGYLDQIYAKCLVLKSSSKSVLFVGLDSIGSSGYFTEKAYNKAKARGLQTSLSSTVFGASHTHASFGAVSQDLLWSLAPATDLFNIEVTNLITDRLAECMIMAEKNLKPAKVGIGRSELIGFSKNRRARFSPHVNETSVDPQLGLIRVDDLEGKPVATLWNFAIHGTCHSSGLMQLSGDVMGVANELIEEKGLGVAIFMNGAAGDAAPGNGMCDNKPKFDGSKKFAEEIEKRRKLIETSPELDIKVDSVVQNFGLTQMNLTIERVSNCTDGGWMNICGLCHSRMLNCTANVRLGDRWVENKPRFTGIQLTSLGQTHGFVTLPGEAIQEIAHQIRAEGRRMGYNNIYIVGYGNNHMGYFTTEKEYEVGGYEGLLSFWGIKTGEMVKSSAVQILGKVRNSK
eukprot:gene11216-4038_t